MSLNNNVPISQHTGNGVTTSFLYDFKIFLASDLVVEVDGVVKTLNVDYSITGIGNDTGDVIFTVAPATGTAILLYRAVAFSRSIEYQYQGALPSVVVNRDIERLWMAAQELQTKVVRSFQLPLSVSGIDVTLPTPVAGRAVKWNATGTALIYSDLDPDEIAAAAAASAQAALDSQNASASSAGQANTDRLAAEQAAQAAVAAAASIDPADLVHKSGDETIQGVKTHTASPIVPDLADGDATTKAANAKFVQRAIALSGRKPGDLFDTASPRAPTGSLIVPVSASNISRSAYPTLFNAITIQTTGSTTNANNTLTAVGSTVGVEIGYPISGPGIQAGTTVTGKTANTITLSLNANATAAGVAIVIAPWGVGDGVSTFGMPYCPVGYTFVQASANLGTATVGEVIAHTHPAQIRGGSSPDQDGTGRGSLISVTGSTGGPANLAAGMRVTKCIQYL
ncbi:hypothetical protein DBR37_01555 [Herminiimonas sp. KBW02]|uniref:hypothetical protein n=1 Tax=Herminiimonas sp. KBW02 TaxID=2153363 RepID=UPI000F59B349|nr:hypothetical protein [Herminiimonas sp. KBW02]RQO38608.1 hypothetical protein DBR37_01555 [Herminiimonas sp. KBW02]